MHVPVDQVRGRRVLDITGRVLGRVDRLMVDTESWAISSLRVRLARQPARDIGVGWSLFRAPRMDIPTGLVMAASDAIILRASLEELRPLAPDEDRERSGYEPAYGATAH